MSNDPKTPYGTPVAQRAAETVARLDERVTTLEASEAKHATAHAAIEQRLDDHAGLIGGLSGEQALVRQRLQQGAASMGEQREIMKADRADQLARFAALKPKPMATWVKGALGAVSLGLVSAIISLIVFIARLPSGEDVKAVRVGVSGDVERARAAAQAVEVRQAELGGDLKVIQAAQVRQEASAKDLSGKLDQLLIRPVPGEK